jgi:hypothetical protein
VGSNGFENSFFWQDEKIRNINANKIESLTFIFSPIFYYEKLDFPLGAFPLRSFYDV